MQPIYSTDLTDDEWEVIENLFPPRLLYPNLRTTFIPFREIVNAIQYRVKTGVQYRMLPKEYPPFRRVNEWHLKWVRTGLWDRVLDRLRARVRVDTPHADGTPRAAEPTVGIVDSQSVKTTEEAASVSGFDGGKKNQRTKAAPGRRRARNPAWGADHARQQA
jgi:putative transposase